MLTDYNDLSPINGTLAPNVSGDARLGSEGEAERACGLECPEQAVGGAAGGLAYDHAVVMRGTHRADDLVAIDHGGDLIKHCALLSAGIVTGDPHSWRLATSVTLRLLERVSVVCVDLIAGLERPYVFGKIAGGAESAEEIDYKIRAVAI